MPIDCRRALADIEAYLDGELDEHACRRVEAHAAACASCGDDLDRLRRTIGLCRNAGRTPLPEEVREKARAAVRRLMAGGRT